jgi:hypothetical protein
MGMKRAIFSAVIAATMAYSGVAAAQMKAMVYKSPYCGCCEGYIARLVQEGFSVVTKNVENMETVKRSMRVPGELASCHTMVVGGYIVEGHVPLAAVERLLTEKPDIIGIALAGMPLGSPGMNGEKAGPFKIYAITEAGPKLYMVL